MKKEMLEYLEGYWTNGRDHDVIIEFINDFFSQYQPERLSEKTREGCDSLNSTNKERSRE